MVRSREVELVRGMLGSKPGAPANVAYYEEFAREYRLFFDDYAANMEQEGDWLDDVFHRHRVRTVLDASCGSGRQAIPLAERGYQVTAADPSHRMLREARRQAEVSGLAIPFYALDFARLPPTVGAGFDAVIALGNGLCNQESRHEIVSALRALHDCCCPNGLCLVGIKDFDAIRCGRPRLHRHRVQDFDGQQAVLVEAWDYADPVLICTTYSLHGEELRWPAHSAKTREYMLGAEELRSAAREAGFSDVSRLSHPSEAVYVLQG